MIIYPDGPSINFVNSILEKDIIEKIPSDYSLNLLTSDEDSLENDKNKIKSNNKNVNVNNIQRELINLLDYENESSSIQEKNEKEYNNFYEKELNNQKYYSNINENETDDLINGNKEKGIEFNNQINEKLNVFNNRQNIYNSTKNNQKNGGLNDINNNEKSMNEKENLERNVNQHIYNNFNIPYINFIYNIGTNGINNNYMNSNIKNSDINNPININNHNNRIINIDSNNFDINKFGKDTSTYINKDIAIFNNKNINNNNNMSYLGNNNNYNQKKFLNKLKNNSYENKYINMSLPEITTKLDLIAKKKHGCKFLEHYLKTSENSSYIINKVFYPKLYWIKIYELSNDLFGNYFIQELIPELDNDNLISFTNIVVNNLLNLCLNPHGTRVVQILINTIKDNKFGLLIIIKNSLSTIMDKLINNLNGSFVLMHFAKQIKDNEMIYDFLNDNLVDIATNSYSCSALQKLIDIGTNQQRQKLIINIINNTNNLVGNQCGLYVLQFIMSKNNYYINDAVLGKIFNKIIFLSKRKYSSNVVEKCLETCSPEIINKLINIFNNETIIRDLIKDIFGNYVIQKLLIVCTNEQIRNQILGYIALEFKNLKEISFGPKLMNKMIIAYPQIRKYL